MNKIKYALIFLFIAIPLVFVAYKYYYLDISLIPKKATNFWRLELSLNRDNYDRADEMLRESLRIPLPQTTKSQEVVHLETLPSEIIAERGSLINPASFGSIKVVAEVRLKGFNYRKVRGENENLTEDDKSRYLNLSYLNADLRQSLEEISQSLLFEDDSNEGKLEKIFYYLGDEVILQPENSGIQDVLTLKSGSYLGQARLLMSLARLNNIPSRLAFGLQITDPDQKSNKYIRVFYVESFVGGRWIPINPHFKAFGKITPDFIVLHNDAEDYADGFNNRAVLSLYAKPVRYMAYESLSYIRKLESEHPFWSLFSLHRFPLSIQAIFFAILLIPFGTVILSFMRVMVGVNTFGIFTPILLTLFFMETSLFFGLGFFFIVVAVGLLQRFLLDKFYLLAVPRLSILLTIVILLYLLFAIFVEHFGLLSQGHSSLSYFPIVIITVFIERFSIYFIEEGAKNTLKTTLGTFSVSVLCYLLLSVTWLKALIFNNPELLFVAIALNFLLGSYQGYRLLEFFRFSEFKKA